MINKLGFLILICMGLCIIGCSGLRKLNPDAVNVNLVIYAPKTCRFLGEIENLNVHRDLDIHTASQELKMDDINFLRNEGAKRGANVVVLVQHKSEASLPQYRKGISGQIIIYAHSVRANIYWCAPKIIYQLKQRGFTNVKLEEPPLFKHYFLSAIKSSK